MKVTIPYDSFKFIRWVDPTKEHIIIVDEYKALIDGAYRQDYMFKDVYHTLVDIINDFRLRDGYIKGLYYDETRHEYRSYFKFLESGKEVTHLVYKEDYE